jgi:hypothetical protein
MCWGTQSVEIGRINVWSIVELDLPIPQRMQFEIVSSIRVRGIEMAWSDDPPCFLRDAVENENPWLAINRAYTVGQLVVLEHDDRGDVLYNIAMRWKLELVKPASSRDRNPYGAALLLVVVRASLFDSLLESTARG